MDLSFLTNIDPVSLAMLTFAIIGFVKLYELLVTKEFQKAGKISVAVIASTLLGIFALKLNWFEGLLIGFNASGLITTLSVFGKDSRTVSVDKADTVINPTDNSQ
jgi:hypothetical protein